MARGATPAQGGVPIGANAPSITRLGEAALSGGGGNPYASLAPQLSNPWGMAKTMGPMSAPAMPRSDPAAPGAPPQPAGPQANPQGGAQETPAERAKRILQGFGGFGFGGMF